MENGLEENQKKYTELQETLIKKSQEYQSALGEADQFDTEGLKKAASDVTDAKIKQREALAKVNESKAADLSKERSEEQARLEAELTKRYTGIDSDEGKAGAAKAEREMLSGRLSEMQEAADRVKAI